MRLAFIVVIALLSINSNYASEFINIPTSVASDELSHKVIKNSSLLGYQPSFSLMFFTNQINMEDEITNRGLYLTLNSLGFGYNYDKNDEACYAFSFGKKIYDGVYLGCGLRMYDGIDYDTERDVSLTIRPTKSISIASNIQNLTNENQKKIQTDIGLSYKPFVTDRLMLSGDVIFSEDNLENLCYNLNATTKIYNGIYLSLGYDSFINTVNDERITIGVNISSSNFKLGTFSHNKIESDTQISLYNYVQISSLSSPSIMQRKESKIVEIVLEGDYKENISNQNYFLKKFFFSNFSGKKEKDIRVLINEIEKLKKDPEVYGIMITAKEFSMSFTQKEELRNVFIEFQKANKKIYSFFENSNQSSYYLLSISDKLYMHPLGNLSLQGLGAELVFYKGILDKLGVKMQVVSKGLYKSFGEQFTRDSASQENIEQVSRILDNLDFQMKTAISEGRKIKSSDLNLIIDNTPFHSGSSAISNKLVDEMITMDKFKTCVLSNIENEVTIQKEESYFSHKKVNPVWESTSDKKIALVYALGTIQNGESTNGSIFTGKVMGSETIIDLIKKARNNPKVKVIVIRVESNGGSVLASDKILNELDITEKVYKKPVIISMGSIAASGGYWLSCHASKIFANKSTQTGSIGVFSIFPSVDSLASNLGIKNQRIEKNKFSTQSIFENLTDEEISIYKNNVDEIYTVFLSKVSEGRHIDKEKINKIAEGRLWIGEDAKANGLVDEIGDLKSAIEYAVRITGVDTRNGDYLEIYAEEGKIKLLELLTKVALTQEEINLIHNFSKTSFFDVMATDELFFLLTPNYVEIK